MTFMERKVITENKEKIEYIKKAITELPKDSEGYIDCREIGAYLSNLGIQIDGKIGIVISRNYKFFDTKTMPKGNGTIRVARIKESANRDTRQKNFLTSMK